MKPKKAKWKRGLTTSEVRHIEATTQGNRIKSFWRNREAHKEQNITCHECESIEAKLKARG